MIAVLIAWARTHPRWTRVLLAIGGGVLITVGASGWAIADGGITPMLQWIPLADTRGVNVSSYELSISYGGVTEPLKFAFAFITSLAWALYWGVVVLAVYFVDLALSFAWVDWFAGPLLLIGDALQGVLGDLALPALFLTIAAAAGALLVFRGRSATGVWEIAAACLIAALASGALSQPLHQIIGADGYIYKARDLGLELSASLSVDPDDPAASQPIPADQLRSQMTGSMVDTFVRQPFQMVNFGRVIDGTDCEQAFTDAALQPPDDRGPDGLRDAMEDCDESMGHYADNPGVGMWGSIMLLLPASLIVLAIGVMIGGSILLAGALLGFHGVRAILNLVLGVLPGGGRAGLFDTIASVFVQLVMLVASTTFLALFMLVVRRVFGATAEEGMPAAQAFVIVDIVLLVGAAVWLVAARRIKALSGQVSSALAWRPGGGAMSTKPSAGFAQAAQQAISTTAHAGALRDRFRRQRSDGADAGDDAGTDDAGGGLGVGIRAARAVHRVRRGAAVAGTAASWASDAQERAAERVNDAAESGVARAGQAAGRAKETLAQTGQAVAGSSAASSARLAARGIGKKAAGQAAAIGLRAAVAVGTGGSTTALEAAMLAAKARRGVQVMREVQRSATPSSAKTPQPSSAKTPQPSSAKTPQPSSAKTPQPSSSSAAPASSRTTSERPTPPRSSPPAQVHRLREAAHRPTRTQVRRERSEVNQQLERARQARAAARERR